MPNHRYRRIPRCFLLAAGLTACALVIRVALHRVVAGAYREALPLGWLNEIVEGRHVHPLRHYLSYVDIILVRGVLILSAVAFGITSVVYACHHVKAPSWRRFRKASGRLMVGIGVSAITLLVVDRSLFLLSPLLTQDFVRRLSADAQLRWARHNPSLCPRVYAPNVCYGNPTVNPLCDELGYRNPSGQLQLAGHCDVLLLGDSFTWGTEETTIADHLRDRLAPLTVYSAAVGGQGPPHWRFHLQRVLQACTTPPRVVVLNYYAGNDWPETDYFLRMQRSTGTVDSAKYRVFVCSGKYHELTMHSLSKVLRLWELNHLLQSVAFMGRSWERNPPVELKNLGSCPFWIQREPDPKAVQWDELQREIQACVDAIRRANPDASILLSYIPACTSIYGDHIVNYPDAHLDVDRQIESSARLTDIAKTLNISYTDSTSRLRDVGRSGTILWRGVHFNPEGYALYSEHLAHALREYSDPLRNDLPNQSIEGNK